MRGGGREIEGFVFVAVFLIGDETQNYVFTRRITPEVDQYICLLR